MITQPSALVSRPGKAGLDYTTVIEFSYRAFYTQQVLQIRIATVRKFLFIIIFLCQHIAMASEAMVVHLPDDSHHFLVSVSQPHTHADLHHDHDDDAHHADESVQAGSTHGDSSGHSLKSVKSTTSTDATLNAASGHDSAAHEHVQHVHLVADLPAESSLTFCAPTQDDAYHYASQLTAITYSPPVPPPNA